MPTMLYSTCCWAHEVVQPFLHASVLFSDRAKRTNGAVLIVINVFAPAAGPEGELLMAVGLLQ